MDKSWVENDLSEFLRTLGRGITRAELSEENGLELIIVWFDSGFSKKANVTMDSKYAAVSDLYRQHAL